MNRADGFSPGSALLVKVPGLDTPAAAREEQAAAAHQPEARPREALAGRGHQRAHREAPPVWAEIDSNPKRAKDRVADHPPGAQLRRGRALHRGAAQPEERARRSIRAGRGFRLYRDRIRTGAKPIEKRRAHFEQLFRTLKRAGVRRGSLYLAWDFTVASERSLTGRMLHIRDDAFAQLGDRT